MKHLEKLYQQLCSEQTHHANDIFNYTIPETWNLYGYAKGIPTKQKEIIVDPYAFTKFTLEHIMKEKQQELASENWYRKSIIYYQITRLTGAWDHDRTSLITHDNLYHLNDHGTFLKAILLLPFYQRIGINTILLSSPFALGKASKHTFENPCAIADFQTFDSTLKDPLLGEFSIEEEYLAFEECAHYLGFHILWQMDMGTAARDNQYIQTHPEWFYWIPLEQLTKMHSPHISYLSKNCPMDEELLPLLKKNEDVLLQNKVFQKAPKAGNTLLEIEQQQGLTTVPFMHDRINSIQPIELDYTPFRFYTDTIYTQPAILRPDLYPGKKKNTSLWKMFENVIKNIQKMYQVDGFYFTRVYLLPHELLASCITLAKEKQQVVILEDTDSHAYDHLNIDGISGNSAYVEYDVWNHQLHNFAYRLKENNLPVFASAEFLDTPRITQYGSYNLSLLLPILNQFLPHTIPMYMCGMECMETQPLLLSYFQDQSFKNALPQADIRYQKQPLLDDFFFEYRHKGMYILPHLLEQIKKIRNTYADAISNQDACIPLCFDSPTDQGIGFAYCRSDSLLLVIANSDVEHPNSLCVHTENLFTLPDFNYTQLHQIFSICDPFIHDVTINEFQNIQLSFEPGEIKFLEFT